MMLSWLLIINDLESPMSELQYFSLTTKEWFNKMIMTIWIDGFHDIDSMLWAPIMSPRFSFHSLVSNTFSLEVWVLILAIDFSHHFSINFVAFGFWKTLIYWPPLNCFFKYVFLIFIRMLFTFLLWLVASQEGCIKLLICSFANLS